MKKFTKKIFLISSLIFLLVIIGASLLFIRCFSLEDSGENLNAEYALNKDTSMHITQYPSLKIKSLQIRGDYNTDFAFSANGILQSYKIQFSDFALKHRFSEDGKLCEFIIFYPKPENNNTMWLSYDENGDITQFHLKLNGDLFVKAKFAANRIVQFYNWDRVALIDINKPKIIFKGTIDGKDELAQIIFVLEKLDLSIARTVSALEIIREKIYHMGFCLNHTKTLTEELNNLKKIVASWNATSLTLQAYHSEDPFLKPAHHSLESSISPFSGAGQYIITSRVEKP